MAQLVARFVRIEEVRSSNLLSSTKVTADKSHISVPPDVAFLRPKETMPSTSLGLASARACQFNKHPPLSA